jgi:hypothetical protein
MNVHSVSVYVNSRAAVHPATQEPDATFGKVFSLEPLSLNIPRYPMLRGVVRHGGWLSIVAAVVVLAVTLAAAVRSQSVVVGAVGVLASTAVFVIGRLVVELVTLVTDMLLPK